MKNTKVLWGLVMFLFLAVAGNYYLTFSQLKMAMVDSNKLLDQYKGMLDARAEYAEKAKGWQANIDTLTKELNTSIQAYEKEKGGMTSKERQLNEELINTKGKQLDDYRKAIAQQSQQEDMAMTQRVLDEVNVFLTDYGKAKGYTIIFGATGNGNIIYAKDYIDITDEVIEKLNANY